MPTYITLARFTRQGLEHIKESPARLETIKKTFQAKGGQVKAFYLLLSTDSILYPKPLTLEPQPSTLDVKPYSLNP